MIQLNVELPHKKYPIIIGRGLFKSSAKLIMDNFTGEKIVIVTDSNVEKLYAENLESDLKELDFEVKLITVPAGEKSKSMDQLTFLYTEFIDFQLTRTDLIVALGGGVVGDLTGFAASTYLRGVPFVQIPTTLLAQIDSSVGGKVAVNIPEGKNLVGSFYHPEMVLIDPELLKTLTNRVFNDGMAEVIKYGCIRDKELFESLLKIESRESLFEDLEQVIFKCCNIKREIVENDELDKGERMLLNFGHTIGHGIEKHYNFETFTHGEAVAMGMYHITKMSEKSGHTEKGSAERIKSILLQYDLPFDIDLDTLDSIRKSILNDKKRKGNSINFVLIKEIGVGFLEKTEIKDISSLV